MKGKLDINHNQQRAEFTFPIKESIKKEKGIKYDIFLISVSYSLGGINYFSGNNDPRGYRLVVQPASITHTGDGGRILSTTLMGGQWESGLRFFIERAKRYNRKRLEELADKAYEITEEIAESYEEEDYDNIISKVQGFSNVQV